MGSKGYTIFYRSKEDIEEIACKWLLKQKGRKLSNTNVECFTEGFQIAQGLYPKFSDGFESVIKYLRNVRKDRIDTAGYSGRYFDEEDGKISKAAEELADALQAVHEKIVEYNTIATYDKI